ncbi:type II secretion system protein [Maricaulis sp.]|uniref:type II secretion system protein n=1 Tax=Maricaulis sp. TaxID=1486257 RepID=UPI002624CBD8|nr:type II secretion system protein [Maricaulis sp.]
MRISHAANAPTGLDDRRAGFTLFELLIALTIMATALSLVGVSLSGRSQEWALQRQSDVLADDLRRVRLAVRGRGEAAVIVIHDRGYRIEILEVERSWPSGLSAHWQRDDGDGFKPAEEIFLPPERLAWPALEIELRNAAGSRRLEVDAITGRVRDG